MRQLWEAERRSLRAPSSQSSIGHLFVFSVCRGLERVKGADVSPVKPYFGIRLETTCILHRFFVRFWQNALNERTMEIIFSAVFTSFFSANIPQWWLIQDGCIERWANLIMVPMVTIRAPFSMHAIWYCLCDKISYCTKIGRRMLYL